MHLKCFSKDVRVPVCDDVREVVLLVVVSVLDPLSVDVDGVVVEARVADEAGPLVPAGGDVAAGVLVQVLAEVALKGKKISC